MRDMTHVKYEFLWYLDKSIRVNVVMMLWKIYELNVEYGRYFNYFTSNECMRLQDIAKSVTPAEQLVSFWWLDITISVKNISKHVRCLNMIIKFIICIVFSKLNERSWNKIFVFILLSAIFTHLSIKSPKLANSRHTTDHTQEIVFAHFNISQSWMKGNWPFKRLRSFLIAIWSIQSFIRFQFIINSLCWWI